MGFDLPNNAKLENDRACIFDLLAPPKGQEGNQLQALAGATLLAFLFLLDQLFGN